MGEEDSGMAILAIQWRASVSVLHSHSQRTLTGHSICLGQQFAITEASYVFVRLLQRFDAVTPAPGTEMANGQKLTKGLSLTMYPGKGVKVQLHKA